MFEITPDMQRDYAWARRLEKSIYSRHFNSMADALRDAVAAWLKAEWLQDHDDGSWSECNCSNGVNEEIHQWTWDQWQAEANRRLMGEG
jgi:Arc/MetJ-type ribon-helix-helix transcriptional regulator